MATASASAATPAGIARAAVYELSNDEVLSQTEETILSLSESCEIHASLGVVMHEMPALIEKGKALRERLEAIVGGTEDEDRMQVLLGLVDRLTTQLEEAAKAAPRPTTARRFTGDTDTSESPPLPTIGPAISTPTRSRSSSAASHLSRLQPPHSHDAGTTSPSFSLGDSDSDDSDNDEGHDEQIPLDSGADDLEDLSPSVRPIDLPLSISVTSSSLRPPSPEGEDEGGESPIEKKSTHWIEEEGEVFRKGVALAADLEEEDEKGGEQLKKEVCC